MNFLNNQNSNGCGCDSCFLIILLLLCCGGKDDCCDKNCGCDKGFGGGCDSCSLIWLLLILNCCGCCGNGCNN